MLRGKDHALIELNRIIKKLETNRIVFLKQLYFIRLFLLRNVRLKISDP